jgi:hypothetical protein
MLVKTKVSRFLIFISASAPFFAFPSITVRNVANGAVSVHHCYSERTLHRFYALWQSVMNGSDDTTHINSSPPVKLLQMENVSLYS